jgi:tRNA U38,U39,U40 pseudouridine synthase TruA
VGTSKYEPSHIIQLIKSRDRKKCGKMVLPNGLYLKNIVYPKQYNINSKDAFPYF